MVLREMFLKGVVINVVLLLAVGGAAITNVAAFMSVTTVSVELIVTIESLTAEATLGVTPESTLINSSRLIVASFLVLSQLRRGKELMLVCENLLVTSAKITLRTGLADSSRGTHAVQYT